MNNDLMRFTHENILFSGYLRIVYGLVNYLGLSINKSQLP
jgi:hypothetical protein